MNIGIQELLIVLGIVILLFGAKKIPQLAKGIGEAIKEFRNGIRSKNEDS